MLKSQLKSRFRSALLVSSLVLLQPAFAQNLPGEAIDTPTVPGAVQTLMNRAQQAYPTTLPSASASTWRLYQGIQYKYFSATGIFVGVKDGQVYLYGGPFATVTPYGTVAAVTAALEARIANPPAQNPGTATSDFGNVLYLKTINDLTQKFSSLTMEYGTTIGTVSVITQVKLNVIGTETVDGVSTTHMTATITASGAGQTYDMWVDANGTFRKLKLGSFEYSAAQAQALGPGIVSGFLISLATMDNAQVKAALSGELQSPALSTKITKRMVGSTEVDTIKLEVSNGTNASYTAYISDFGSFTMMTQFSSKLFTQTSFIEMIDMQLR